MTAAVMGETCALAAVPDAQITLSEWELSSRAPTRPGGSCPSLARQMLEDARGALP